MYFYEIKLERNQFGYFFTYNNNKLFNKVFKDSRKFTYENIAAVKDESGAYHIDIKGYEIYKDRYLETFDFKEGFAVVKKKDGYFHIDKNGNRLYDNTYNHVTSFKDGVAVAEDNNGFFHINSKGQRIYKDFFKYASNFEDGKSLVIINKNYKDKYLYIDMKGSYINTKEYLYAKPYKNSFAVVMDNDGYYHINKQGEELYEERFKKVENFNQEGFALGTTKNNEIKFIYKNGFHYFLKNSNKLYTTNDVLNEINKIGHNSKVILFLRGDYHKPKLAIELGSQLKEHKNNITFFTSPRKDNKATAKHIKDATGSQEPIIEKEYLGNPNIYFMEEKREEYYQLVKNLNGNHDTKKYHNYILNYFFTGRAVANKEIEKESEILLDFLKGKANKKINLFISHSFMISTFMRYYGLVSPQEANKGISELDGVVIFIIDGKNTIFPFKLN